MPRSVVYWGLGAALLAMLPGIDQWDELTQTELLASVALIVAAGALLVAGVNNAK